MDFIPQSRIICDRHSKYGKVSDDSELRRLHAFRDTQDLLVVYAFRKFVKACKSDAVVSEFKQLYEEKQYVKIVDITRPAIKEFAKVLEVIFTNSGNWQNKQLQAQLDITRRKVTKIEIDPFVDISFDPGDAEAERLLRQATLALIREIEEAQRDAIRKVLADAVSQGLNPTQASRMYRDLIGLTQHQMSAVNSYRRLLESGSTEALQRSLRDKRFDSTIQRILGQGLQLSESQINRMVDRYRQRMIDLRAITIARTETQTVMSAAQHSSTLQLADAVGLNLNRVERTWRTITDGRERDTHHDMNNQKRGAEEKFVSPSGARLLYPGDLTAPGAERINCRCSLLVRVLTPEEVAARQAQSGLNQAPTTLISNPSLGG